MDRKRNKAVKGVIALIIVLIVFAAAYVKISGDMAVSKGSEVSRDIETDIEITDSKDSAGIISNVPVSESRDTDKSDDSSETGHTISSDISGSVYSDTESEKENTAFSDKKTGHYETIPAYDETVLVREAYDEQILVKKGECTDIEIKDAWDEETMVYGEGAFYGPDTQEGYVCNGCGAVFYDAGINDHIGTPEHPGWHNEQIALSEPYWHNVSYQTIHHDAVYETRCEPDEYTTIHHDAEYKIVHHEEQRVWIED